MLIILCTIANVLILGGSIQVYRVVRQQVKLAENHAIAAEDWSGLAGEHSLASEEHSKTTQHFAGVRLIAASQPSGQGHNIGRR